MHKEACEGAFRKETTCRQLVVGVEQNRARFPDAPVENEIHQVSTTTQKSRSFFRQFSSSRYTGIIRNKFLDACNIDVQKQHRQLIVTLRSLGQMYVSRTKLGNRHAT